MAHRLTFLAALSLLISIALPWWHDAAVLFKGYENPEGYFVLATGIFIGGLSLYNILKTKNILSGLYLPSGVAVLLVVTSFYYLLKQNGKPIEAFSIGLYIVLISALLLLVSGIIALIKKPGQIYLSIAGSVLLAAAVFVYNKTMNDTFEDSKNIKADFETDAASLIKSFETNNADANKKYREKNIAISGRVATIEIADTTANIKMADTLTGSYIIFAMQRKDAATAKTLKKGDSVLIKGFCSGGEYSDILEATSINFQRAVLEKKF